MDQGPRPRPGTDGTTGFLRVALVFALGGVLGGAGVAALHARDATRPRPSGAGSRAAATEPASLDEGVALAGPLAPTPSAPRAALRGEGALRFVAIGGGADPTSTQVQLEQDIGLFAATVGGAGVVLFAGGPEVRAVQVLDPRRGDEGSAHAALLGQLGELLDPRPERRASFRVPAIPVDAAADAGAALELMARQLELPGERLEVFVAAHGERGEAAADNYVALWGDGAFDARELAAVLARPSAVRDARVVVTACYGGGFAEIAFAGGEWTRGPSARVSCGLFATSSEDESSGCDANPDRRAQEGYALHLLHALRGRDREGRALGDVDLDADGRVGLLEAHTRARIAARSIDLPSTTSERFLRALSLPPRGERGASAGAATPTPEEDAVIAAFGVRLGVTDEAGADALRAQLEQRLEELGERVEAAFDAEADARHALALEVAARFPELLDPFRADFGPLLDANGEALAELLRGPLARGYERARLASERVLDEDNAVRLRWVEATRLARAFETRRLALALRANHGPEDPSRRHYEALLACERAPLAAR